MTRCSGLPRLQGLRLHDNPALVAANTGVSALYPVFCLDPVFIRSGTIGANRINFLLESLECLDDSLRKRGSRLIVLEGDPQVALPAVMDAWGVRKLCFEKDTEPYARARDGAIVAWSKAQDIQVSDPVSHTLWDTEDVVARLKGRSPGTLKQFQAVVDRMPPPAEPIDAPDALVAVGGKDCMDAVRAHLWNGTGEVPTFGDLGLDDPADGWTPFKGGEKEALKRLDSYMARTSWVCSFEKPKGNPAAWDPEPATTVLSPYLKFGCCSVRLFHKRIKEAYARGGTHTKPPTSLEGQLLWREFYYTAGLATPNFHKMQGNPDARQIPWKTDLDMLHKWEHGQTGFPWIDACMNQLRQVGWLHHLARHAVACFLTRGDLYIHWELGREVFDKYLLDADYYINNGNWQWLSCTRFFYQYFRVYSPISYGKKYDANGDFIRKFVPALKDYPAKYIYEPWKAPKKVQEKCGCVIGKDYPEPMVDHAVASKACMAGIKDAYDAEKAGAPLTDQDDYVAKDVALGDRADAHGNSGSKKRKREDR